MQHSKSSSLLGVLVHGSDPLQRIRRMALTPLLLKLYLILPDEGGAVCEGLINQLGEMFETVSQVNPRLVVIPLFPWAGWKSIESIQALGCAAISDGYESTSLEEEGQAGGILESKLSLLPRPVPASSTPHGQFKNVAMGGTFDRLHSGHMLLLATAALVTSQSLYIGITSEALLRNKAHAKLLQPYEERAREAASYVHCVRPSLNVVTGMLKDPMEPTEAELNPDMEAIVVSLETLAGAEKINEGRRGRGFSPLQIITVPLVGGSRADSKLSSSGLRAEEDVKERS